MSSYPELVGLGVGLDISAAEAGLASLGGSAEGVAAGLEDRLASASDGMKELGKRSSTASRGIQGLASVISLVDPRLGQVVRSVGTLARGMSVLRLGLGPAAAAVTLVTGALALYQHEQRKAAEEAEAAEQRARDLTTALEDQHAIYLDLQTQMDLINGNTDRFAVQFERRKEQIEASGQAVTDALDAEIAALEEKIRVQEQERRVSVEQQAVVRGLKTELASLNEERRDAVEATDSQIAAAEAYAEYLREQKEAEEFLRRREEARREAARKRAEAERKEAEARRERQQQEQQYAALVAEVSGAEREAKLALMTDEERLNFLLQERLARLEAISQQTQDNIATEAAANALKLQTARELTELQQRQHEEEMARKQAEADAAKAIQDQQRQAAQEQIRMATDIASSTSQLVAMGFKDKQAAQVAEGTTAAILAGINTIASNPTPFGIAQAGLNVALAMAQVAKMRNVQPSFHRGGFGDEFSANMRRGEAVLSTQGRQMMGDDAIRQANAGQRPGGGQILEVRQFYRHRPYDEFARDNLQRGGPLRTAINDSRSERRYHRTNRNGA